MSYFENSNAYVMARCNDDIDARKAVHTDKKLHLGGDREIDHCNRRPNSHNCPSLELTSSASKVIVTGGVFSPGCYHGYWTCKYCRW